MPKCQLKVKMCAACPYQRHRGVVSDVLTSDASSYLCISCPSDPMRLKRAAPQRSVPPIHGDVRHIQAQLKRFKEEAHEDLAARP